MRADGLRVTSSPLKTPSQRPSTASASSSSVHSQSSPLQLPSQGDVSAISSLWGAPSALKRSSSAPTAALYAHASRVPSRQPSGSTPQRPSHASFKGKSQYTGGGAHGGDFTEFWRSTCGPIGSFPLRAQLDAERALAGSQSVCNEDINRAWSSSPAPPVTLPGRDREYLPCFCFFLKQCLVKRVFSKWFVWVDGCNVMSHLHMLPGFLELVVYRNLKKYVISRSSSLRRE